MQDLITLARILADSRDTLALGALLRGPLVGLTEEALLDATAMLPPLEDSRRGRLLRETLAILQALAKGCTRRDAARAAEPVGRRVTGTPLAATAADRTAERALANIDQFLEAARPYDLKGLQAFAQAITAQWKDAQRSMEGRPDTEHQSVSLVTMHASKALDWPVVVPINMGGQLKAQVHAALDADGRLHVPVFGMLGPGAKEALQAERDELERERHRIRYVAATRARDLLQLPEFSIGMPGNSWMERFGLQHHGLDAFAADKLGEARLHRTEDPPNTQSRVVFETEAAMIDARTHPITRVTPHLAEAGEIVAPENMPLSPLSEDPVDVPPPRGSLARGLVLHKLLEEMLSGETA